MRVLLAILLLAGSAQACSIAVEPWDHATFTDEDTILYSAGGQLMELDMRGPRERALDAGFFLQFAGSGAHRLVAGQDGLGADCSGTPWMRLYENDELVREWDFKGAVASIDGGAYILSKSAYALDWGGTKLTSAEHPGAWMLAVREDAKQWVLADEARVAGEDARMIDVPNARAAAYGPDGEIVVAGMDYQAKRLHVGVYDDAWRFFNLSVDPYQPVAAAWSDAAIVVAGQRAFRITDEVVDLGVPAVNVAARGDQFVLFTEDGYYRFHDRVTHATRGEGWTVKPGAPVAIPVPVVMNESDPTTDAPAPVLSAILALGVAVRCHQMSRRP